MCVFIVNSVSPSRVTREAVYPMEPFANISHSHLERRHAFSRSQRTPPMPGSRNTILLVEPGTPPRRGANQGGANEDPFARRDALISYFENIFDGGVSE